MTHLFKVGVLSLSTWTTLHTNIFSWWRFTPLSPAGDWSAWGFFLVCAVGLHHLALLCRNNMLLLAGLLPRGGAGDQISYRRSVQGGGLGVEDLH